MKANTAISDCPQLKSLMMSAVHVNSSSLLHSASHNGTCWLGISLMCQSKMIFPTCPKTLIKLWPQLTIFETNAHWHVYQMTPSTLTFGVSLMSQPRQVPGAWGRCVLSFMAKKKKKLPEIFKMLVRWFPDTFCAHSTTHLKRPSVKGLQGAGMSKYPHHHRRLQVSGHVSISASQ